jgi:hypothetical protein
VSVPVPQPPLVADPACLIHFLSHNSKSTTSTQTGTTPTDAMPSKGKKASTAASEPKGKKNKQAGGKQGGKAVLKDHDAKKKGRKGADTEGKKKGGKKDDGEKH